MPLRTTLARPNVIYRHPLLCFPHGSSKRSMKWVSSRPQDDSLNHFKQPVIYTGRFKHYPSLNFYAEIAGNLFQPSGLLSSSGSDIQTLKQKLASWNNLESLDCILGLACSQLQYHQGDLVEIRFRNGDIGLAVVQKQDDHRNIRVLTTSNDEITIPTTSVAFVLRGCFTECDYETIKFLHLMIYDAYNLSQKMSPYWRVVYAQNCQANRIYAVDLKIMARQAFLAAREEAPDGLTVAQRQAGKGAEGERRIKEDAWSPVKLLAAYIGISNCALFGRTSNGSPLFAYSEIAAERMRELNEMDEDAFLDHYASLPDTRLADTVSTILTKRYPERDTDSWLTSPNNIEKLSGSSEHPLLKPGMLAWYNDSDKSIHDGLEAKLSSSLSKSNGKDPVYRRKVHDTVYSFNGHHDLAFSVEVIRRDLWRLSLHIPDISFVTSNSKVVVDTLMKRNKSFRLARDQKLQLVPDWLKKEHGFSTKEGTKNCITISMNLEPWQPLQWSADNITIEQTRIAEFEYLDPDETELALGWQYRQLGESMYNEADFRQSVTMRKQDRDALTAIRDLMDKFYWNRMDRPGSVYTTPAYSQAYELQQHDEMSTVDRMVQEAKITAGQWCAMFAGYHQLAMPFLTQEFNSDRLPYIPESAVANTPSILKLIYQRYLGPEWVQPANEPHHGLGAAYGYIDIGSPFDNVNSLYAHWQLRRALIRMTSGTTDRAGRTMTPHEAEALAATRVDNNSKLSVGEFWAQTQAQSELIDTYLERIQRYDALKSFERSQQRDFEYHIFRCTIVIPAAYPGLASAYCQELDLVVDIALVPGTEVEVGDRVVCNEILELCPIEGVLVLSI